MSQDHPAYANLANLKVLEELYARWLENPESVDHSWQNFFDGMQFASTLPKVLPARTDSLDLRISLLVNAYRTYGHLLCHCDVTDERPPDMPRELALENFGLSEADLTQPFPTLGLIDTEQAPLQEILNVLQKTYCKRVGVEYMDLVPDVSCSAAALESPPRLGSPQVITLVCLGNCLAAFF